MRSPELDESNPALAVVWRESVDLIEFPRGHGIGLYDSARRHEDRLAAFVDGFEWLHGFSDEAVVYCIPPDDVTTAGVLAELSVPRSPAG